MTQKEIGVPDAGANKARHGGRPCPAAVALKGPELPKPVIVYSRARNYKPQKKEERKLN